MLVAPHQPADVDAAMVDDAIASRRFGLTFPRPLERLFERETGVSRSRQLVLRGCVGLAMFILYLYVDLKLTPDVLTVAVALRLGLVVPLALILMVAAWFNPPVILREAGGGMICLLAVLSTFAIMLLSSSPIRDSQSSSIILVILFVTVVQRLRFPYAVVTCLAIFGAYAAVVSSMPEFSPERFQSRILVFAGAVTLALFGLWHAERHTRTFYLVNLRARLRNIALEDISHHDPMTGLDNRRSLDRELLAMRADGPTGEDIAIVLFDIDHFKAYNDGLGHLAGDTCLKRIANIVQAELRDHSDGAYRFGGEEFLLLLRHTDLRTALTIAERMRRAIEAAAIPHPARNLVTASFGVAATKVGGAITSDELIHSADAALYAAKRNGRNQVWPPFLRDPTVEDDIVDISSRRAG
jgi:diguanylate cyclase (GGDEF)-like protein